MAIAGFFFGRPKSATGSRQRLSDWRKSTEQRQQLEANSRAPGMEARPRHPSDGSSSKRRSESRCRRAIAGIDSLTFGRIALTQDVSGITSTCLGPCGGLSPVLNQRRQAVPRAKDISHRVQIPSGRIRTALRLLYDTTRILPAGIKYDTLFTPIDVLIETQT